jgi:hypothetical protein
VIVCPPCELDLPGYTDQGEAAYLAGVHNDLHHGSRCEASVVAVSEPPGPPPGWRALGGGL